MGCVFGCACSSFSEYVSEKQAGRISDCAFTGYIFQRVRERLFHQNAAFIWQQNKWIGKSESDVMGMLPAFNADYILTYLSSVYGTITAILLCCVLAVLIFAVLTLP